MMSLDVTQSLASDRQSPQVKAFSEISQAGHALERATWAAREFGTYSATDINRIVSAVADVASRHAEEFASATVDETGFGVVEHKIQKNLACSTGLLDEYAGADFVTPRVDSEKKVLEIPRPAGVIFALAPSTNPVATVYFKVLLSLMTRNAVLISPHPMAKVVSNRAAEILAEAAVGAGAPDGVIQSLPEPSLPLIEAVMKDERTKLILATGGTAMVRSAYSSSNPALGVGPGNVPVFVDSTADVRAAAAHIVDSKKFDNSVLCTNESVLIAEDSIADSLVREMSRLGAHFLTVEESKKLADVMYPTGRLNSEVVGKDAHVIAGMAGINSGPKTKVLVAPISAPVPEEVMTHEKLAPVLGFLRVTDAERGISAARAIVRIAGAGHSAAIHSTNSRTIMAYGAAVPVLRMTVNAGNSTGSAGLGTSLATSMTIGTGFVGRSGVGENLQPSHLVNWTKVAHSTLSQDPMPNYSGLDPWRSHDQPVPEYPVASNAQRDYSVAAPTSVADGVISKLGASADGDRISAVSDAALRDEIRRLVAQELANMSKG